jgi:hypothetical protein
MKIGLVLTGFSRFYKHTFPFFSNFINENNVDVYISTWDVVQSRPSNWNSNSNSYNFHVVKADKDEIIRLYSDTKKLINYNFENWSEYYSNRFDKIQILDRENDIFKTNHSAAKRGSFWIERLRDQWYIVKKGWDLIENPEKYDRCVSYFSNLFVVYHV